MAEYIKIRCADCRYVRQDKSASNYTRKKCKGCECGSECKFKNTDDICPKQKLKIKNYECGCVDSEYYKSLLNVTRSGNRTQCVVWSGCKHGESGAGGVGR